MTFGKPLVIAGGVAIAVVDLGAFVSLVAPNVVPSLALPQDGLLAVHTACTLSAGALLGRAAPSFVRHTAREIAIFAACFAFFVPVLGPIGVLAVLLRGLTEPRPTSRKPWLSHERPADLDERHRRVRGIRRQASAAEIGELLRQRTPESAGARFRAVLATRHLTAKAAVPLLRVAQSDPSDEIRLYAFSRLENMRGEIEKRIELQTSALAVVETEEAPRLQLRLAESYWDLGCSGLTEGAVREHALRCANRHAASACELARDHAAAEFFLGKVLLQLGDVSAATAAFDRAARAGYPAKKLLPHLAECAFLQRDYAAIRARLLELDASPHESADFHGVIDIWTREGPSQQQQPHRPGPARMNQAARTEQVAHTEPVL
ncbi:MAG: Extracellular Matrix protein PelE [Labilithrix sp.]|nr:Extracellular Matrix protein PelE [Labilithrix sp.]